MNTLTLPAPAKINYLLDVVGKRPDGYHDLRMIMQRINLCDEINISLTDTKQINIRCDADGVPDGPKNIIWQAARVMLDIAKTDKGINMQLIKKIPVAAGLGGGSSDAATVLMGLNELLELNLSEKTLIELGTKLGADVPFFIFKKTAVAEGIGNILTPISTMPNCWILLVNPGIHISTAWVYRSLQLTNSGKINIIPKFFGSIEQIVSVLSNDLESVTIPAFPVIAEIKKSMINLGAAGSLMSGSGATVFGVFKDFKTAEAARIKITKDKNWFATTVETI